jgi:predicted nuclease of predicted toxin-antitoxin system
MSEIRFYLDENVDHDVARGLRTRNIDVMTTAEVGTIGQSDTEHLAHAFVQRRVIITSDEDFLKLSSQGLEHAGIVYFKQQTRTLKEILRALFVLHAEFVQDDMMNHIEFL